MKATMIGGGMTAFGKHTDRNLKSLVEEAVNIAIKDAGIEKQDIQAAYVGNASQGVLQGQESIRGQVVLHAMGIGGIPIVNLENACASSATALNGAMAMIAAGEIDCALVLGMEKMYFEDRARVQPAFTGCMDVEVLQETMARMKASEEKAKAKAEAGQNEPKKEKSGQRTVFMDVYAQAARFHMDKYGTTQRQLAAIAAKNHWHSSMNPLAQYQQDYSIDEVLASPDVAFPLTRLMCSPIGDGVAAAIVCSEKFAREKTAASKVEISSCVLGSAQVSGDRSESNLTKLARRAYDQAGVGPEDIDLAEVHDATSMGEISSSENLMLCDIGDGGAFGEAGHSKLGGKLPINVSGGLECQGHPIGATGIRQVVELFWHLSDRAGDRQVAGAKVGLAQNAGGTTSAGEGALSVTILKR
ncbi:MAG TPA: thiolase family protein [Pseudomonadales bacterium]|jgi:acetyl-CoA acetyltransferase|nr:thiolase [Gammaproteobacteria bacterium]MDP6025245.1 thiolase family protein [Pseudomonadales bacterium]MDP6315312.1 thiolase family protein [Pseudomonadales bacterium]MDP7314760.1 thiolase family protein [Pseudomonadales bacterium]HJP52922.1 thiolase family protein [Pseudomonadales bacterium]|tara:strand:+ start:1321 stop:2565 length:1245 start_codon:yes stop_codon:yes gene_type:complete